jgi:rSAM/selenodomain-associated transferase 2
MKLSIVMPVLNEADGIDAALKALQIYRIHGVEIVVADGASSDGTADMARGRADRVVSGLRGRGLQMNAGAVEARGDVLLFLHADTQLPADADRMVLDGLKRSGRAWGCFNVRISGGGGLGLVAFAMNLRSRLTGICTGDQAMFMTRAAFDKVGCFPPIALMEDVEMSKRLKRLGRPLRLKAHVVTSGRRWQANGVMRTILMMWSLRLRYFFGADPEKLARAYRKAMRK